MQIRSQFTRSIRFLKGEAVHSNRDRFIWAVKILGLMLLLGLILSPFIFWALRSIARGGSNGAQSVPGLRVTSSPSSSSSPAPSASRTPPTNAIAPVKGLTDEPSYRWWRWPNAPQPDSWWANAQDPQSLQPQIALMHELGVKLFRVELAWALVAPDRPGDGVYDSILARNPNWRGYHWQAWDAIVQLATAVGIQVVPQVVYSPDWASGVTTTADGGPNMPPQSAQFYGDFVFAAVTRFKGQIHYWEMWNEPDIPQHTWNGSMQQYVGLILKPGYQAVKQVDPKATVLLGGLAGDDIFSKIYAAGGQPYFDIANFHAYSLSASGYSTALSQIYSIMQANGDEKKPIWLTEFGLKTQPDGAPGNPGTISPSNHEAEQAQLIHDVYSTFQLQAIFYYQLHDTAVSESGGAIVKVEYYGLVSRDYSHRKLGFKAYKEAVGGVLLPTLMIGASGRGVLSQEGAYYMTLTSNVKPMSASVPTLQYDVVMGAGPYGLSAAAYLFQKKLNVAVFGKPMNFWREHMPRGCICVRIGKRRILLILGGGLGLTNLWRRGMPVGGRLRGWVCKGEIRVVG